MEICFHLNRQRPEIEVWPVVAKIR